MARLWTFADGYIEIQSTGGPCFQRIVKNISLALLGFLCGRWNKIFPRVHRYLRKGFRQEINSKGAQVTGNSGSPVADDRTVFKRRFAWDSDRFLKCRPPRLNDRICLYGREEPWKEEMGPFWVMVPCWYPEPLNCVRPWKEKSSTPRTLRSGPTRILPFAFRDFLHIGESRIF